MAAVQRRAWTSAYRDLLGSAGLARLEAAALVPAWRSTVGRAAGGPFAVLVACSGPAVVGFVMAAACADPDGGATDGEVTVLVVDPDHQRAGHGSRLLTAAADHLRNAGMTTLAVWVPGRDHALRSFLASAGLEPDGARRELADEGEVSVHELRMVAALSASHEQ
jgi:GNAT superfamily N-acetyltransferase